MKPISRASDPAASHAAGATLTYTGARKSQNAAAAALVAMYPGFTSLELSFLGPLDRYQLARRLAECDGMTVKRGSERRCHRGKRLACTWYPIEEGDINVL